MLRILPSSTSVSLAKREDAKIVKLAFSLVEAPFPSLFATGASLTPVTVNEVEAALDKAPN